MRWSAKRQRLAMKLQSIERARRSAAEARLSAARSQADEARSRVASASDALADAERQWAGAVSKQRLDLSLQLCLANELLSKERLLRTVRLEQSSAEEAFERRRRDWQSLETGVRAGDRLLGRGRRFLGRRQEAASDHALSELTTWRWFKT